MSQRLIPHLILAAVETWKLAVMIAKTPMMTTVAVAAMTRTVLGRRSEPHLHSLLSDRTLPFAEGYAYKLCMSPFSVVDNMALDLDNLRAPVDEYNAG